MNNLYNIVFYFNNRINGIIKFKDFINKVEVSLTKTENYGDEYMRVYFDVDIDRKKLKKLPNNQRKEIDKHFANNAHVSGSEFIAYIIHLHKSDFDDTLGYDNRLKRLKEFYDCYNVLTTSLAVLCKSLLKENTPIIIQSIINDPEFVYLQKFWEDINFNQKVYSNYYGSNYEMDYSLHNQLLELSETSIEDYQQHSNSYFITEKAIIENTSIDRYNLRRLILNKSVPIKIDTFYIIEDILINADALYDIASYSLALEINDSDDKWEIKKKNNERYYLYLLHNFILEKKIITQKVNKGKHLKLIKEDILLLKNNTIVSIDKIINEDKEALFICINIRKDLSLGKRYTKVTYSDIAKVLHKPEFDQLIQKYNWKEFTNFKNWLIRKNNGTSL